MGFNFVARRKYWYILSLLIIIPGIISLFMQGLNLGIDFKGGSMLQIQLEQPAEVQSVRSVMEGFGLGHANIQMAGENQYLIRTVALDENTRNDLISAFKDKLGNLTVLRDEKVEPVIANELIWRALGALLIASILKVIYISFRFEFKFGIAAIIALLHDVLVVLGVFSIFRFEVDTSFIAAILTIIGYSINDTIVIFDRIRENLKHYKKEALDTLVNNSVNQTLTRSVNTVLAVIFVLVALFLFGGESTKMFALAMLVGVISGAYSSICNASQLWYDFMQMAKPSK